MGLIEMASANSVWRGMDYYESGKVVSWKRISPFAYDGIVSGSENNKYSVHIYTVLCLNWKKRIATGDSFALISTLPRIGD